MSEQAEKEAKFYIQKINAFKMLHNKNIKTFFKKFVIFFKRIYKELNSRFPDYNIKDEKDIKLFENFVFFIGNYDFIKYDTIYKEIWKESLLELDIEEKKKIITKYKNIKFINDYTNYY